ncbi:DUF4123 domain-containing protein [Fibrella arboris]|uniref:DUF4123 domain-containing protein n=1 Tax=Fibrella arboris TaxID=3242486 RepID=UPI00352240B3
MAYCLLDAARMDEAMEQAKDLAGENNSRCLYAGSAEQTLSHVAPYLFMLQKPDFVDWVFTEGWGHSWGVYLITEAAPEALFSHLKRFLYVRSPDGTALYFRFYDPRALRLFLPTCDMDQLTAFFGPVRYVITEDEDTDYAINFSLHQGQLQQERVSRADVQTYLKQYLQTRYPSAW